MKIIRQGSFETNSSSSHSIAFDSSVQTYQSITPDEDGFIVLRGGQFGWEWRRITDPLTKANYCAVAVLNNPELTTMLLDVIKEHTGAEDVYTCIKELGDGDYNEESYIDHNGEHEIVPQVFESKEKLKEFIFRQGILFTGNDNEKPAPNFYDVNLTYTHKLVLEGSDIVYLLENDNPKEELLQKALSILWSKNSYNIYSIEDYWKYEDKKGYYSWFEMKTPGELFLTARCYKNGKSQIIDEKVIKYEIVKL